MTATTTDPRTDLVRLAADNVDHIVCDDCWSPGMPMLCGEPDDGEEHPEDCGHPRCPMCADECDRHSCPRLPWWRRWLP